MSDERTDGGSAPKKAYDKPTLTRIQLEVEEAVLSACKVNGVANPTGNNCRQAGSCPTQIS